MSRLLLLPLAALSFLLIGLGACNDPFDVGGELLNADQLELDFTDTLTLTSVVVPDDSLPVYQAGRFLGRYFVGELNDPIFGTTTANVSTQIRLGSGNLPDFSEVTVDSLVLVVPILLSDYYGEETESFTVEVLRLTDNLDPAADYFADTTLMTDGVVLGSQTVSPVALPDSVDVAVFDGATVPRTVRQRVSLRIPVPGLINEITGLDTTVFENDTTFTEILRGLQLRTQGSGNGLLAVDLSPNTNIPGLQLFYRRDTSLFQYRFPVAANAAKVASYRNDYSTGVIEPFLEAPDKGDSLIFIQGLAGAVTNVEIPGLADLGGDLLVNRATLDVFVAELPEDDTDLDVPEQLVVLERVDGDVRASRDLTLGLLAEDVPAVQGGTLVPGSNGEPGFFRFNVTAQVNAVLAGEVGSSLQLSLQNKSTTPNRVVLYGPGHSQFPARLQLSVTRF